MQCKDVMLTLVYRCHERDAVADCARLMRDQKIGFVPVLNDREDVVGVATDRDIVVRALAEGKPASCPLREIMTPGPLLTCRMDEDIRSLERHMAHEKKGRAVVLDSKGGLAGVISLADIAKVERSSLRTGRLMREVARRESVALARP